MASLTTSEEEVRAMGGEFAAGHFTSAPYFMSRNPREREFVAAFQKKYGKDKTTNFVSEPAYFQVYLFAQAAAKLAGSDLTPPPSARRRGGRNSRRRKGW